MLWRVIVSFIRISSNFLIFIDHFVFEINFSNNISFAQTYVVPPGFFDANSDPTEGESTVEALTAAPEPESEPVVVDEEMD